MITKTSARQRVGSFLFAAVFAISTSIVATGVQAQDVTINFRDADIRSVVESIAEITGISFVLDPRVQGQITIISPMPINEAQLYEAFLSALQVQGFQAVEDGVVTRIVPFSNAFRLPDGASGNTMITEVVQLNSANASEMVNILRAMMSNGALIQPVESGNYIIVTDTASQIARMHEVLGVLDDPTRGEVEVFQLLHISAGEAIQIASGLSHLQNQSLSIVEDSYSNRLIVSGSRSGRSSLRQLIEQIDVEQENSGALDVIYLNYAEADQVKPLLDTMISSSVFSTGTGAEDGTGSNTFAVEADLTNNALILAAPAAVSGQIKELVRQLDRPRKQVLIEAVIAEVSEDQAQVISSQLAYASANEGGLLVNYDSLIPTLLGIAVSDDPEAAFNSSSVPIPIGLTAGGVAWDESGQRGVGLLIEALKSDANTNILSTPSLVTLNNEEASISIGQEVPFLTGSFTSTDGDIGNVFQTIDREEVGIRLMVVPRINENNEVRLELEQESSNLLATASQAGTEDVVTAKRLIATNVMVEDGEFLVLGGLIDESVSADESRVPLLGRIPLLGNLFKSKSNSGTQSVLMMFIRPTVLDSRQAKESATQNQYQYIRERQLNNAITSGNEEATLLPVDPEEIFNH